MGAEAAALCGVCSAQEGCGAQPPSTACSSEHYPTVKAPVLLGKAGTGQLLAALGQQTQLEEALGAAAESISFHRGNNEIFHIPAQTWGFGGPRPGTQEQRWRGATAAPRRGLGPGQALTEQRDEREVTPPSHWA